MRKTSYTIPDYIGLVEDEQDKYKDDGNDLDFIV
jgi:hypothetical protein